MDDPEQKNKLSGAPEIEGIEVIELLGRGGMSCVYKARQTALDRIVALKVLLSLEGDDALKRFQKEAKITSLLKHPNIIETYSFGVSKDGKPYLILEYLEGMSLQEKLKAGGALSLQSFKNVFLPVLSALSYTHEDGLIHRDIKPANVFLAKDGSGGQTVKLLDFGIARADLEAGAETSQLTKSGAVLGTPAYMSPEQCQAKPLDGRSDLYSLSCVMYESLCNEAPFTGDSPLEVMHKHCMAPAPLVSDLSRKIDIRKELAALVLSGLAKEPVNRPQTASEFAKSLNEVLDAITLDKAPSLKEARKKNKLSFLTLLLVFVALVVSGLSFYLARPKTDLASQVVIQDSVAMRSKSTLRLLQEADPAPQKEDQYAAEIKKSAGVKTFAEEAASFKPLSPHEKEKRLLHVSYVAEKRLEPQYKFAAISKLCELYDGQLNDLAKLNKQLDAAKQVLLESPELKQKIGLKNSIGLGQAIGLCAAKCHEHERFNEEEFFLERAFNILRADKRNLYSAASYMQTLSDIGIRYSAVLRHNGKVSEAAEVEAQLKSTLAQIPAQ